MSRKFFLDGKNRTTFDIFKSNICHRVKDNGDIPFIIEVLQSNVIFDYLEKNGMQNVFTCLQCLTI